MSLWANAIKILFRPTSTWNDIAEASPSATATLLGLIVPFAAVPAVCWYIGVTQFGWNVAGQSTRMTPESALPLCALFYLVMVAGCVALAWLVRWMSPTYGSDAGFSDALALIAYSAMPFFVAGVIGLYPILVVDLLLGVAVACACIVLLYLGTPSIMRIPTTRSFLYASSIFAIALVAFVAVLSATIVMWDFVGEPEFRI